MLIKNIYLYLLLLAYTFKHKFHKIRKGSEIRGDGSGNKNQSFIFDFKLICNIMLKIILIKTK